ncbi:MAG: RNA polymerase sigma factor [Acidobacteria bacterium]|nr:RNA polymerase sigma factor [Acidobacteriota bacterium]
MTDTELVERARGGEAAAFGELIERHQIAAVRAAMAVLGNADEAREAAQDAFVLAFRRLGSFRGEASFKTWLLTITWHQAINRRRGIAQRLKRLVGLDDTVETRAADPNSQEHRLVAAEHAAHVKRLVRSLPRRYREALMLAATRECTFEEMARIVGVASGTLKWRVNRARTMVRAELAKLGYQDD